MISDIVKPDEWYTTLKGSVIHFWIKGPAE